MVIVRHYIRNQLKLALVEVFFQLLLALIFYVRMDEFFKHH